MSCPLNQIMSCRKKKKRDLENFEEYLKHYNLPWKPLEVHVSPTTDTSIPKPMPELCTMSAWRKDGNEWIQIPVEKL